MQGDVEVLDFLLFLGIQAETAVAFVPHTRQGSVERFVLWCGSFEEGLQSLLVSETASVGMWRSLVETVAPAGGN